MCAMNPHDNFPEAKETFLDFIFCPKPKHTFSCDNDKEKQQILSFQKFEVSFKLKTFLLEK